MKKECKYCKKIFHVKPSLITKKYCSMKCRRLYERKYLNIKIKCLTCKKAFILPISKTKKGWGKFCGRDCFHRWHGKQMSGKSNPRWNSKKVTCYVCGQKIYRQKLLRRLSKIFYCSRKCQHSVVDKLYGGKKQYIKYHHQRRKALMRSAGTLTVSSIFKIYNNNMKKYETLTCIYCLKKLTHLSASIDHRKPLSRGGTHHIRNLAIACKNCNSKKKNKTEKNFRKEYGYEKN